MKVPLLKINGTKSGQIELPLVFSTEFRKDLIHKSFTNLQSHKFQPQGRHPTAGMDVVARSNDPPTGRGTSRIAKMRGGGGGRQGEAGGVASVRGGRQAHPPNVKKVIYKKLNKKEKKLALCSAIAATASKEIVKSNGHSIENIKELPIIVSDEIENISISDVFEMFSISSETIIGNSFMFSMEWPLDFTISFDAVAAIAEHNANFFSFLFNFL
jgi:large subunit ribosomal protein L4e